eukprot:11082216-Karenia_brevis.AAC.1
MFGNGSTQVVGAQANALSQQEQDNLVDKLGSVVQKALNSNAQSSKDNNVGSDGSVVTPGGVGIGAKESAEFTQDKFERMLKASSVFTDVKSQVAM